MFDGTDAATLTRFSEAVDRLWNRHTAQLRTVRQQTTHEFPVWGHAVRGPTAQPMSTRERQVLWNKGLRPDNGQSSDYQRLKLVMDYWCSLWFWPLEKASLLPSRHEFLFEIGMILEGTLRATQTIKPVQGKMFGPEQPSLTVADEYGFVDIRAVCEQSERLKLIQKIADELRFFHWELEFADVFADRGGFDLILGNPPWIKIEWNEGAVMGDEEPVYLLRDFTAPQLAKLREEAMKKHQRLRELYLAEYAEFEGTQAFLNAKQNYPLLVGSQSNTFKCFVTKAWDVASEGGTQGFLHPEGVYDDPKVGSLRAGLYPRLRCHFHFLNERQLFAENDHHMAFSVNVYGAARPAAFHHISNLFGPATVDVSFAHDGYRFVPGIKNDENDWNEIGHLHRIVEVDEDVLALFAALYDKPETPALRARLPALHARELVEVLKKFAAYPKRLGQLAGRYTTSEMWHETNAVKAGTIRRETKFPGRAEEWVLSGPHIYAGTPLFKTPRAKSENNGDYNLIDLTDLPEDYLPRTNYVPDCAPAVYRSRLRVCLGTREKRLRITIGSPSEACCLRQGSGP